jgi:predicted transcriptional regulator
MKRPTKFIITTTDEFLTSQSGLAMIGALTHHSGLGGELKRVLPDKKEGAIESEDAIVSMMGLLSMAKPDYAAIEQFRDDDYFSEALGLRTVPSEPTLRQRLDEIAAQSDQVRTIILNSSASILHRHAPQLTPCFGSYVAIDGDVSPFDNSGSKKEGVSCTYKMMDGYAPMFAYIGNEGYLLNAELREGKQHCQQGTPEFLRECFKLARKITDQPLVVRLDSGNDAMENILACRKAQVDFVIKRNIRSESIDEWLLDAQALGQWSTPREGKTVYVGETTRERDGESIRVVFEVIERTITAEGQILLVPEIEVHTWWTSFGPYMATPDEVVAIYHGHGTSEQYHSEIKSDMALERLPSGKFATNSLILMLAVPVFNMLRLSGVAAMRNGYKSRKTVARRRIRTIIQDFMYMAARLICHARRFYLAFSNRNPLKDIWASTYLEFA